MCLIMNKKAVKSNFSLLLAAAIWGLAFVAQSDSMNYIGPLAFTALRYFLGAFALIPVCVFTLGSFKKHNGSEKTKKAAKRSLTLGAVCGVVLFGASVSQQIGLKYTTAGKAGFITALYIVLVPVMGRIVFKNKTSVNTWISVVLAAAGLYLLCVKEGFSISRGDLWVILCAFIFTVQILLIDRYAEGTDTTLVSMTQFLTVAVITVPFALIFEPKITAEQMSGAWISIAYTGIFSSAVGYTLQIVGQKSAENPTIAALLMSMESVFAALSGWLILHETLSGKELIGVALMACAIVLSQLPVVEKNKKAKADN